MTRSTPRRDEMRDRILRAAEAVVTDVGVGGLKARELASRANVATGSLYKDFADIDAIMHAVNARTLGRMLDAMGEATADSGSPAEALRSAALAYLRFARANRGVWQALFERPPSGREEIDHHVEAQSRLMTFVEVPLAEIVPELSPETTSLRSRTLFSAIHGIVVGSLVGRFTGAGSKELETEIVAFVDMVVRGSRM